MSIQPSDINNKLGSSHKDKHTKFSEHDKGAANEKRPYDRSLSRQQDNKQQRKDGSDLTSPDHDQLAYIDAAEEMKDDDQTKKGNENGVGKHFERKVQEPAKELAKEKNQTETRDELISNRNKHFPSILDPPTSNKTK